ncbi:MAG: SRPBCC domain-containing protein [Actinomycetes bacterium]|jgi:uncharacterized protein YndB with AHSA1/START domain
MSVLGVDKDFESLTLTLTAEFDAPIDRVWNLWEDPRKLERWWGPPHYPATFETYEFRAHGNVTYYMTGPDGERYHSYWTFTSINPPKSLEFNDGFAHEDGTHNTDMPTTTAVMELSEQDGRTRMVMRSTTGSREHLDTLIKMGMIEGLTGAVGQMDALLV